MNKLTFLVLVTALIFTGCENASNEANTTADSIDMINPPVARKEAHEHLMHGDSRMDNYFWMRLSDEQKNAETPDAQTQEVLDYLNAENDYCDQKLAHTKELQETLYNEIVGRIAQTDMSVPSKVNGYWYYNRYEEGQDYAFYCRKMGEMDAPEEVLLDGPAMGKGLDYFAVGGLSVSTNNEILIYGVDTVSRRQYTLYFKNLTTGEMYADKIENTTGSATWANDNKTVFYTRKDPVTLRSYRIYKHVLGTDAASDELVYEETDETFSCGVYKTKSRKYIMIGSWQTLSSEYRFLDADNPNGEWTVVQPRERDLEYRVSHYGDDFYITTNLNARNFRLMKTPVATPGKSHWTEMIAHREDVLLEGIEIFKDFLIIEERKDGLSQIRIQKWDGSEDYYMEFQDPAYTAYVGYNPEFDTHTLRYGYTSLTTPSSTYEYDLLARERTLLKQQEVVGGFSPDEYVSERIYATAADGTKVPVSLVYRKGTPLDGTAPLLLYGYGSYGNSIDPYFSSVRLSLLDRGFIYAIAHIRGGQEMGRHWYEDGKLLKKRNTFTDFIDCGNYLMAEGYTSKGNLYAMGGSAGGLLMGAIVNMAPDMWNGVVAAVPFVDVVTTMLDESIPLTTGEWDEWGNPNDKAYYDYMKSYSPYDNVEAKAYPNMLVTTGYWDSQVQYWEPAKWVALLRDVKTDDHLLLMHCDMESGHGGASGRFKTHRENALVFAFLLDLAGKAN
ncbi:MAG: S9 family peptidase [Flavobacteriales bacterium]|nr:S9 family peptidase [Flavobacteriales bacterium]